MNERPWWKNYDPGVPRSLEYPPVPLTHFLEEYAQKYPAREALIFQPAPGNFAISRLTYAALNELTDRLAAGLHSLEKWGSARGQ